jgi:hypothetical protein
MKQSLWTVVKRLLWAGSLVVAHSLVMDGLDAIAQLMRQADNVDRGILRWIQERSTVNPDGSLNPPIPITEVYSDGCPADGNWLHNLAFDPDQQIVFVIRDCQLTAIDYRLQ